MPEVLLDRALTAGAEHVPALVLAAGEAAARAGLAPERALHLELAVEEAAVNICTHAYHGAPGPLRLRVLAAGEDVRVELTDEGPAYSPLEEAPPDLSAGLAERPIGGLGVHLMRQVTDELHYERRGERNILTLIFRRRD